MCCCANRRSVLEGFSLLIMSREEFVDFLIDIGFKKALFLGSYVLNTDIVGEVDQNFRAYIKSICVNISNTKNGVIIFISISEIHTLTSSGQNLFTYSLNNFTEQDKISFITYILPFFNSAPDKFRPYLRDNKIDSILK